MIKVIFDITREDMVYFCCENHATENPDVCVAASTLCGMLVRYMASKGFEPKTCRDGKVEFNVEHSNTRVNDVFRAAMLEFKGISDDFPSDMKVY